MADEQLELVLKAVDAFTAETKRLGTALDQINNKTKQNTKEIKQNTKGAGDFGKAIKGLITIAMAYKALAFLKDSLAAWAKQEMAVLQLQGALRSVNIEGKAVIKTYENMANKFQSVTIYGDELILQQQTMLTQYGIMPDMMEETLEAAMDLASGLGIDLSTAVDTLARAHEGETMALKRYFPELKHAKGELKDFGQVLDAVNKKFGGQARIVGAGTLGDMAKMSNAWGDLTEKVGEFVFTLSDFPRLVNNAIIPALNFLIDKIDKIIKRIHGINKSYNMLTAEDLRVAIPQAQVSTAKARKDLLQQQRYEAKHDGSLFAPATSGLDSIDDETLLKSLDVQAGKGQLSATVKRLHDIYTGAVGYELGLLTKRSELDGMLPPLEKDTPKTRRDIPGTGGTDDTARQQKEYLSDLRDVQRAITDIQLGGQSEFIRNEENFNRNLQDLREKFPLVGDTTALEGLYKDLRDAQNKAAKESMLDFDSLGERMFEAGLANVKDIEKITELRIAALKRRFEQEREFYETIPEEERDAEYHKFMELFGKLEEQEILNAMKGDTVKTWKEMWLEIHKDEQEIHQLRFDTLKDFALGMGDIMGDMFADMVLGNEEGGKNMLASTAKLIGGLAKMWGQFYIMRGMAAVVAKEPGGAAIIAKGLALLALGSVLTKLGDQSAGSGGKDRGRRGLPGRDEAETRRFADVTVDLRGASQLTMQVPELVGMVASETIRAVGRNADYAIRVVQ